MHGSSDTEAPPSLLQSRFVSIQNIEAPDSGSKNKRLHQVTIGAKKMCARHKFSPLAKRKALFLQSKHTRFERLTKSRPYELMSAVVIVLNAAFIACDAERRGLLAMTDANQVSLARGELGGIVVANLFCFFFLTDLCLRLMAEGLDFFRAKERLWNWLDILVVFTAVLEVIAQWHQYATTHLSNLRVLTLKFSMLRIIRLLRIVRTNRSIRASRHVRELRIMVHSLTGAMKPLAWSVVLMCIVLLIFGVFLTEGTVALCITQATWCADSGDELLDQFGTLSAAMLSLYMAMSGGQDWGEIWTSLGPLPGEYQFGFLVFLTFAVLALLNVVTAVFVETAMQQSQRDRELLVQQEVEQKVEFVETMQRVFEELDTNGSGTLSLEEFEKQMDDENVLTFLSTLELDIDQVRTLLTLLDLDQNGEVDIEEFITGCLRLKGGAKSLDMAILQYQVEWILHNTAALSEKLGVNMQAQANLLSRTAPNATIP